MTARSRSAGLVGIIGLASKFWREAGDGYDREVTVSVRYDATIAGIWSRGSGAESSSPLEVQLRKTRRTRWKAALGGAAQIWSRSGGACRG
ncbi:leucine-rich repeat extensin-like protein 3 [Iris pallida]|uniref:Leucine-rich repeat extensin-like protein 3 n=1 Tax=Iris pallida TaxID=29817 RepID=A0AAX6DUC7_IRIPA|nr:leucine-rich repeat extensin-like protein 3 [Iris pallida]